MNPCNNLFSFLYRKIGYEHNDNDQITKPEHRIIADAYAKRMDGMISISIENSHTDPAGLNFDMKNLDSIASDAMSATLTNYLSKIIHRRNAMTDGPHIDFNDPNSMAAAATAAAMTTNTMTASHQHSSLDADNNSEISVSVRHFSVESRRNSADSQVSQVSVKMSKIKARLESRKQKRNKDMNVKSKKRPRNQHLHTRHRANRSKQTTKYKYPVNDDDDSMSENFDETNGKPLPLSLPLPPIKHQYSACTTADIDDFNQLLRQNPNSFALDDEMQIPSRQHIDHHLSTCSVDSVDAMGVKSASIDQLMQTFWQTNTANHSELFNSSMNGSNGYRKNGENRMANCKHQVASSSLPLPPPPSALFITNDPAPDHLKNFLQNTDFKNDSCDIGIQANDYEIGRYNSNGNASKKHENMIVRDKKLNGHAQSTDNNYTETNQLLPNCKREPSTLIIRKENLSGKHLKRLLLPSN